MTRARVTLGHDDRAGERTLAGVERARATRGGADDVSGGILECPRARRRTQEACAVGSRGGVQRVPERPRAAARDTGGRCGASELELEDLRGILEVAARRGGRAC